MKRKRQAKRIEAMNYGQCPFFGSEESADAADAARYRWLVSPACDYGFIADLRGATKAQWDAAIDEMRKAWI